MLLPVYARPNITITHASKCTLYASDSKFLDLAAGIAVVALGHADKQVAQTICEQAHKVIHTSNILNNEHAPALAQQLVGLLPLSPPHVGRLSLDRSANVFFCNSGTEANEAAIKFARAYSRTTKGPSAHRILSFTGGFHGRTFGALSATHTKKYQEPFMPLVPAFDVAPFNDIQAATELITNETSAVIVEPIQGEGGIIPATDDFLIALRNKCSQTNSILIFDEIQAGLGRTGSLFAYEQTPVVPDIITLAKPLANGLPIGATILSSPIASAISQGTHGTTFGGNPLCTAVARTVLARIAQKPFLERVKQAGALFASKLSQLASESPIISTIRGRGLMIGIQLAPHVSPSLFVDLARRKGVIVVSASSNTIRIVPPLIIEDDEINHAISVFENVLRDMESLIATGKDQPSKL